MKKLLFLFSIGSVLVFFSSCETPKRTYYVPKVKRPPPIQNFSTPEVKYHAFDGSTTVRVEPWTTFGGDDFTIIKIGARWNSSEILRNYAVLIVQASSLTEYFSITKVEFNIDEEMFSLKPLDVVTKFERPYGSDWMHSSQEFLVPLDFVRKTVNSNCTIMRVHTRKKVFDAYLNFQEGGQEGIVRTLVEFLKEVDKHYLN